MNSETVDAIVGWQRAMDADKGCQEITFHGGEPLSAGFDFYRETLPRLKKGLAPRPLTFSIQSNLWLLTDEMCSLFNQHRVSLGTSLDGPEEINDCQRGQGYFKKTMKGIDRARAHGLEVGCICTFTSRSAPHAQEIFDFFLREGLNFTIHAALPSIRYPEVNGWSLSPQAHGKLLVDLLESYLPNLKSTRISTLDSMCRSISQDQGCICTFDDCLGGYLAVAPDGGIYPCQRFAGMPDYQIGNVHELPTWQSLNSSPVWHAFEERQAQVQSECGDCSHWNYCRGGCPYNALAASGGRFDGNLRDPHCEAYRHTFRSIKDRAMAEVFSDENMQAVVQRPNSRGGLLQKGRLLSLLRAGSHPYDTARHALLILSAVVLAVTRDPVEAARRIEYLGFAGNLANTERKMRSLYHRLTTPAAGLNNLYLHVTFACPLHCSHCYARGGEARGGSLPVAGVQRACQEAANLGFRHAVITGGEPLVHPQRTALLEMLADLRTVVKPLLTVLRTSLAIPLDADLMQLLAHSTDEVVVSVDGDEDTHDARRGKGSYALTVSNLRSLAKLNSTTRLSLAAVLSIEQTNGKPGDAVRALAQELGIQRTRFRPLLPLGRAVDADLDIVPETIWGHADPVDVIGYGFNPVASCGIGQNLYVEPDGASYPCYAWHGERWFLGSINGEDGLPGILNSKAFQNLANSTVNSNMRCANCSLRYLCGGACRAWNRQASYEQNDLNAPPADCSLLRSRAHALLLSALNLLEIDRDQWQKAGLPLLDIETP